MRVNMRAGWGMTEILSAGCGNCNYEREWDFVFLWGWDVGFAKGTERDKGFQFLRDLIN